MSTPDGPDSELLKRIAQLEMQLAKTNKHVKGLEERIAQLEDIVEPGPRRIVAKLSDRVNRSLDGQPGEEIPRPPGPKIE